MRSGFELTATTGPPHMSTPGPSTLRDLPTPEGPLTSRCGAVCAGTPSMKPPKGVGGGT